MNDFKLKTESDNIFLVNLSDTGNFLSPLFFQSSPIHLDHSKKLKNIANVNPIRQKPKFKDDELVPYVGLPETDEHTQRIVEVVLRPYKEVKGRNIIYKNDILFARIEPSIFNKKYIFADDLFGYDFAFTSTEFYIIEQKEINIEYVFKLLFSDFVFNQIKGKTTGSTGRRRLDLDVFKNLDFPVIKNIDYVTNLYNDAYQKKQQQKKEAKEILASIDTYLLDELGIELPEKDNSLKNRIFTASISEISGGRFDPFYLTNCLNLPISTKFEETEIYDIAKVEKGQSITSTDAINGKYPVIAGGQSSPYRHNKFNQNKNVITISASGAYSGFVWYHSEKIFASDCSVVKSKNEEKISTEFIFNVLKLKQQQLYNLQQGSGQPHVYPSDIKRVKIPLPNPKKQKEINNKIRDLRNQAKQLELDAEQIMTEAKEGVEKIILG